MTIRPTRAGLALFAIGLAVATTACQPTQPTSPAPVDILQAAGTYGPVEIPGLNGKAILPPTAACSTGNYVAGPGETAIVQVDATASPAAPVSDVLYVHPAVWTGSWSYPQAATARSAESLSDMGAYAGSVHVVPLTAGTTYRFGVAVSTNTKVTLTPVTCHVVVEVERTER